MATTNKDMNRASAHYDDKEAARKIAENLRAATFDNKGDTS